MKNLQLTFQAPITENAFFNNEFLIKGIAITSTITDNNHKFLPEELEKAAATMTGIPLLVDHDNSVDSVIGKVNQGFFDQVSQNLEFEAKVMNTSIQEKITSGLINSVSIGATVEDIEEEDGIFIPKGIKIRELSIVAVPADQNAKFEVVAIAPTFQMALQEAFTLIGKPQVTNLNSSLSDNDTLNERGSVDMENEKELKTQLAEQEAKIAEFEKKERSGLEAKYADLCLAKNVDHIDVGEIDSNVLRSLIQQVDLIKLADVDEEKPEPEVKPEPTPEPEVKPDAEKEKDAEESTEDEEDEEEEVAEKYRIYQTNDGSFTTEYKNPRISNYVYPI